MSKREEEERIQIGPRIPKKLKTELDIICAREGSDVQDVITEMISEYVKVHGEGNPIYPISNYFEEGFRTFPSIGRSVAEWKEWIEMHAVLSDLNDLESKLPTLLNFVNNKKEYGTTNVRRY